MHRGLSPYLGVSVAQPHITVAPRRHLLQTWDFERLSKALLAYRYSYLSLVCQNLLRVAIFQLLLGALAIDIVVIYRQVVGRAKLRSGESNDAAHVIAQLATDDHCVLTIPLKATHGAPSVVVVDFDASHVVQSRSRQSNRSIADF